MIFRHKLGKNKSRNIAMDRLKILLISDRVECNPDIMDMLKEDIAKVISKYLEIDSDAVGIQIKKTSIKEMGEYQAKICANAPIKSISNSTLIRAGR